jgi:hypothetical protein
MPCQPFRLICYIQDALSALTVVKSFENNPTIIMESPSCFWVPDLSHIFANLVARLLLPLVRNTTQDGCRLFS